MSFETYQEARLVEGCVEVYISIEGKFHPYCGGFEVPAGNLCKPEDHCESLDKFFEAGHKFEDGDSYIFNGEVIFVGDKISAGLVNGGGWLDDIRLVLSAKALGEKVELSAEDAPEGATHYCDGTFVMMNDSTKEPEQVEWNGEGDFPPVGWRGLSAYTEEGCGGWTEFHDGIVMGVNGDHVWVAHHGKIQRVHHISCIEFKELETPEQNKERALLEAAYDLYVRCNEDLTVMPFADFSFATIKNKEWLKLVNITGYRKPE